MRITALGIDLAKSVFQLQGVDAEGNVAFRKELRRSTLLQFLCSLPPCLIGMEACASSHHWAREITALGHEVRLIPPAYVKLYVKREKNDAAVAEKGKGVAVRLLSSSKFPRVVGQAPGHFLTEATVRVGAGAPRDLACLEFASPPGDVAAASHFATCSEPR